MGLCFTPPHRSIMQVRYYLARITAVKVFMTFMTGLFVPPHRSEDLHIQQSGTSRVSRSRPRVLKFGSIHIRNNSDVYLLGPKTFES